MSVADRLVGGEVKTGSATAAVTKSDLDRWARSLAALTPGTATELPGGRGVTIEAAEDIPTKSANSTTARYKLHAEDGETLFIVKHSRVSKKDAVASNGITRVGVRVRVSSLSESRRFYEEILGLSASRTGDSYARYGDGLALEVAPDGNETLRLADPDFVIHLETQDVAALHAAVRSSGARVVEALREEKGRSRFTCTDPDGHLVEVVAPQAHR
jgi:catechol 2,3-dioxygenase-like lactoylglutathione lyase family enzyme